MKKNQLKRRSKIIAICSLIVIALIVFVAFAAYWIMQPSPIDEVPISTTYTKTDKTHLISDVEIDNDSMREKKSTNDLSYFKTIDEAWDSANSNRTYFEIESTHDTYYELNNSLIVRFYSLPRDDDQARSSVFYEIGCAFSRKKSGEFSAQFNKVYLNPRDNDGRYLYDFDDSVVYCLLEKNKSVLLNQLEGNYYEVEDYDNFFFGAWDNKNEVDSLEICGLSPTEVIPFRNSDGDVGYLWYVIDEEGIISSKLEEVNYGDFTYNDIKEKLSLKCTIE